MKYFIIALLFSCNIVTAMHNIISRVYRPTVRKKKKDNITLKNFNTYKIGDSIVASAQVGEEKYSVYNNTKDNTWFISLMNPVSESDRQMPGFSTQGVIYEDVTDKHPKLLSAFKEKIDESQKQEEPSQKVNHFQEMKSSAGFEDKKSNAGRSLLRTTSLLLLPGKKK